MSTLFERYKEALLRGHLAGRQGEPELALTCYEEAATFAPDRPLPHSARGAMLLRLHQPAAAAAAFADALERAPADPGALAGRGEALAECGRPAEGAAAFDTLVTVLVGLKNEFAALEVATRALELAESKPRRKELLRRIDAVRSSPTPRERAEATVRGEAIARAEAILAAPVTAMATTPVPGPRTRSSSRSTWVPLPEAGVAPEPEPEPDPVAEPVAAPEPEPEPEPEPVAAPEPEPEEALEADPRASLVWTTAPEPAPAAEPAATARTGSSPSVQPRSAAAPDAQQREPLPIEVPPTGVIPLDDDIAPRLRAAADAALDAGEDGKAALLLIDLAREDAARGRRDAALDSCYRALAVAPDDLTLHLLLVQLYLERGWRDLASEKLELLERLTDLDGDSGGVELVRSARRVVARNR